MLFTSITALKHLFLLLTKLSVLTNILWQQHRSGIRVCNDAHYNGNLQVDAKALSDAIPLALELPADESFSQHDVQLLFAKTAVKATHTREYVLDLGQVRTKHCSTDDVSQTDLENGLRTLIHSAKYHWEGELSKQYQCHALHKHGNHPCIPMQRWV
jgi:hypothetical protein